MNDFTMNISERQEQFSVAYISAVASTAGFSVEEIRVDVDSVDLTIMQFGYDDSFPLFDSLRVQLKCTYAHKPKGDYLKFPLKIKNYNDLRRETSIPRILVVVHIPENVEDWLEQSDKVLAMHHCGYWLSLRGLPKTSNETSVTVDIPTTQPFTVQELQKLMRLVGGGKYP